MTSTVIKGYKAAQNYIIELNIDTINSNNNLCRKVMDKNYAKYRCDRAFVCGIYHKFTDVEIDFIKSDYDDAFIYKKNEYINEEDYDPNIHSICTYGIHFYLSKEAAYFHNIDRHCTNYTDEYKQWYDNGLLCLKCNYTNGIMCSLERWYPSGQLEIRSNTSLIEKWYNNGQQKERIHCINGEINGLVEGWYTNGQLHYRKNYIGGKLNGMNEMWSSNGKLDARCNYENDELVGVYEKWCDDGYCFKYLYKKNETVAHL